MYFDYNLIKMQSPSLSSVVFEQTLLDSADKSLLSAAVVADSLTNAVAEQERIEKLPSVAATELPAVLVGEAAAENAIVWRVIPEPVATS